MALCPWCVICFLALLSIARILLSPWTAALAKQIPCLASFLLPLPKEGGCSSLLGLSQLQQWFFPAHTSSELCWGPEQWLQGLEKLPVLGCLPEPGTDLVPGRGPQASPTCATKLPPAVQPAKLHGFFLHSLSPPAMTHFSLYWDNRCLKILPFVFRQTGLGRAPCHVGAQGHLWASDSHTVVGFFSCSGLGALPWLPQGWTWRETQKLLLGQHCKGYGPQQRCREMSGALGDRMGNSATSTARAAAGSARTPDRGMGKAVQNSTAMLKPRRHGQSSVG